MKIHRISFNWYRGLIKKYIIFNLFNIFIIEYFNELKIYYVYFFKLFFTRIKMV